MSGKVSCTSCDPLAEYPLPPCAACHGTGEVDVDDLIDQWHAMNGKAWGVPLHEYLGMTWEQYKVFVERGELPARDKAK